MSDALKRPGPDARFAFSHELFGRTLGAVTLLAWLSLHTQLEPLFGPRGIVPLGARMEALIERDGGGAFFGSPSIFFGIGASLPSLHATAITGELAALAMVFGVAPGPTALLSFALYLSFVSVGWPFIPLQWDTLLLEALVLAALLGRWAEPRPSRAVLAEPSILSRWVGFSLVLRLMLASGLVKLLSGDPTWRDGTAMTFHHWTQPLPSPLAPFFFALPEPLHRIESFLTLALEIGAPVLFVLHASFAHRVARRLGHRDELLDRNAARARRITAFTFALLMLLIALSGNYGFFNLLTVVLCIPLLDDTALASLLPRPLRVETHAPATPLALKPVTVLQGSYLSLAALAFAASMGMGFPAPVEAVTDVSSRFHVAGHYGLFAVMTTDRHELVFEATRSTTLDETTRWEPYDFWEKPGDVTRGPRFCAPHMPRFDWMLWFAALGDPDAGVEPWIARVARGLIEDRAETRALFRTLPLEGQAPSAVRLVRMRYRFAASGPDSWVTEDRRVVATWRRRPSP